MAFGGVLKALHQRRHRTLSHEALARLVQAENPACTIGGPTLWRWENGEVDSPDPLVLRQLARIYDVEYSGLLAVLEANRVNERLTAEDGQRILEAHGTAAGGAEATTAADRDGAAMLTPEDIADTAATLIDIGERLHGLAESLLGRQAAALSAVPSARHETDRARRRSSSQRPKNRH